MAHKKNESKKYFDEKLLEKEEDFFIDRLANILIKQARDESSNIEIFNSYNNDH